MIRFGLLVVFATPLTAFAVEGPGDVPSAVRLEQVGHGWRLTDDAGMTLYTYTKDPRSGFPLCKDDCTEVWPPLLTDTPRDGEEWSTVRREDGALQWTFRGKPLYRYMRDAAPGDMNGDQFLQQWYVAVKPIPLPPGFGIFKTQRRQVLVDQKNMTLYTSTADQPGTSACDEQCAETWVPVEAWWTAKSALDDWSIFDRADGTRQWTYKNLPLYRYSGDYAPGEFSGEGIDTFTAVVLEPPPPIPDWVTFQPSDAGELMADADGNTLYVHDLTKPRAFGIGIGRDMARPDLWIPVYADENDQPVGLWSIVEADNGRRQWAHMGLKLYIHKRDLGEPGALNGQRSTDRVWRTIMTSGQTMAGSGN